MLLGLIRSRRVVMPASKACWASISSWSWDWAAISAGVSCLLILDSLWGGSLFYIEGSEFIEVDERFADGGVGIVEVVIKLAELFGS